MDDATIELVESMRWCDVRLVGFAWIEAGKSVLLTLRLLPDERKEYLLCRWVELVKIDLDFGDRDGGSPLSWEGGGWHPAVGIDLVDAKHAAIRFVITFASATLLERVCSNGTLR